jgi:hypothetical protein
LHEHLGLPQRRCLSHGGHHDDSLRRGQGFLEAAAFAAPRARGDSQGEEDDEADDQAGEGTNLDFTALTF